MANEKNLKNVDIESSLIVSTINDAILSCYGVYGLSDHRDDRKDFVSQGIALKRHADRRLSVEVHLVISSGMKITEVLRETQNVLSFVLNKKFPNVFRSIDVCVDALIDN